MQPFLQQNLSLYPINTNYSANNYSIYLPLDAVNAPVNLEV